MCHVVMIAIEHIHGKLEGRKRWGSTTERTKHSGKKKKDDTGVCRRE